MEIIIKNGGDLQLTHIPVAELELVQSNNDEIITDFKLSNEDKVKLYAWCILNADMSITETTEYQESFEWEKLFMVWIIENELRELRASREWLKELIDLWMGAVWDNEKLEGIITLMWEKAQERQTLLNK